MRRPSFLLSLARLLLLAALGPGLVGCRDAVPTSISSPAPTISAMPGSALPAPAYWPTQGWRTSSPSEQGMDGARLGQMIEAVKTQNLTLHSLLVIRHGYLVSETYFGDTRPDTRREIYSCTKSFVATLIGIAIAKGAIAGVGQPVAGFFPEHSFKDAGPEKAAMTLEHLLTMTSGLAWDEGDPAYRAMYMSRDWVRYVMDLPMREQPGSRFNYCSGCSHVLSAILQAATGRNVRDFAEQELFGPLGITGARWDNDAQGIPIGGWGLQLTPREMAKLGFLYLHNGLWDGRPIVSPTWVQTATAQHTVTDGLLGYGYQWWTYPKWGAYAALGRYGQTIFVVPDLNLIVVTTAATDGHDAIFRLIEQYIVPAVQKPSP